MSTKVSFNFTGALMANFVLWHHSRPTPLIMLCLFLPSVAYVVHLLCWSWLLLKLLKLSHWCQEWDIPMSLSDIRVGRSVPQPPSKVLSNDFALWIQRF